MTAKSTVIRNCAECKYAGSWHYREDPVTHEMVPYRCPNFLSADLQAEALKLTAEAHRAQFEAAKGVICDAALARSEFSANTIRDQFEAADITDRSVIGAAFNALANSKNPPIEGTGRFVQSTDQATRHRIQVWASRIYRQAAS